MYMQFLKNSNDKGEHEDKIKSYKYKWEECGSSNGSNRYASNNERKEFLLISMEAQYTDKENLDSEEGNVDGEVYLKGEIVNALEQIEILIKN